MCVEIYQSLRILLKKKNLSTAVGDEGGFAPDLKDSREILELILEAVKNAGYEPGKDIGIAIEMCIRDRYYQRGLRKYYEAQQCHEGAADPSGASGTVPALYRG